MECVEIWEPLKGDINGVRQTFKNRMKKRYDGWKDNYDEQWDKNSFLFVLKKDNEYIATCRMIVKRYYDFNFKIPMEEASVKSFSLDKYHNICLEGGMVSFKDFLSFGKLMYYVGSWLYENEVDYLFTCYDVENELIKNLYVDMLNFEIVENAQLVYGNFTSKKQKKK